MKKIIIFAIMLLASSVFSFSFIQTVNEKSSDELSQNILWSSNNKRNIDNVLLSDEENIQKELSALGVNIDEKKERIVFEKKGYFRDDVYIDNREIFGKTTSSEKKGSRFSVDADTGDTIISKDLFVDDVLRVKDRAYFGGDDNNNYEFIVDTGIGDAKFKTEDFDIVLGGEDGTNEFLIMSGKKIENPEINYEHLFKVDSEGTVQTRDLVPQKDITYDIGKPALRYRNIYAEHLIADENGVTIDGDIAIDYDFAQGSVIFADAGGGLAEDNSNFYWDDVNNRLGIGTNNPGTKVDVTDRNSRTQTSFRVNNDLNEAGFITVYGSLFNLPLLRNNASFGATKSIYVLPDASTSSGGTSDFGVIVGGFSESPSFVIRGSDGKTIFQNHTDSTTSFQILDVDGGIPIFNVDTTNERVGIGTASPERKLEVLDSSNLQLRLTHTDNSIYTDFQTTSAGNLIINPTGDKIGINDLPTSIVSGLAADTNHSLVVASGTNGVGVIVAYRQAAAVNYGTGFGSALQDSNSNPVYYSYFNGYIENASAGSHRGGLDFYTATSGALTAKMRVAGNGDVQIGRGITAPTAGFDVLRNTIKFQPSTDSTNLFQILDADGGTPIFNIDSINERVGIGTTNPWVTLDVVSGQNYGFRLSNSATDSTQKSFGIRSRHYLNAEEDIAEILSVNEPSGNLMYIGGGDSSLNAMTAITFYTASNYNTLTGTPRLRIDSSGNFNFNLGQVYIQQSTGNIGVGTSFPSSKLEVSGGDIRVTGGSFIDDGTTLNVPDYVFDGDYQLLSFDSLEKYIYDHRHLPNVPSREELKKDGMNYGEMMMNILEKTEENTLYSLKNYHDIRGTQSILEVLKRMDAENDLSHEERIKKLEEENSKSVTGELVTYSTEEPSITSDQLTSLQNQLNLLEEKLTKLEESSSDIEKIFTEDEKEFIENLTKLVVINENGLEIAGDLKVVNIKAENIKSKTGGFEEGISLGDELSGTGVIERGKTEKIIKTEKVKKDSKIYLTSLDDLESNNLFYSDLKEGKEFIVKIGKTLEKDIEFNWLIVD